MQQLTTIRVNTRVTWYQVTRFKIGSNELADRMAAIAVADSRRYPHANIEVTATDNSGEVSTYRVTRRRVSCPHCGGALD